VVGSGTPRTSFQSFRCFAVHSMKSCEGPLQHDTARFSPFECMPRPMHTSSFVICGFNLDRRFPAWQLISILRRVMLGFGLWRRSLLWARVVTIDTHRYAVNAQNRIGSAVSTLC